MSPCELDAGRAVDAVVHAARLVEHDHERQAGRPPAAAGPEIDRQRRVERVGVVERQQAARAAEHEQAAALVYRLRQRAALRGVEA